MMRKEQKFQQNRQLLWEKITGTKDSAWWTSMRERGKDVSLQLREARKIEDEKKNARSRICKSHGANT